MMARVSYRICGIKIKYGSLPLELPHRYTLSATFGYETRLDCHDQKAERTKL